MSFKTRMEDPVRHAKSPTTDLGAESEPGNGEQSEVAD